MYAPDNDDRRLSELPAVLDPGGSGSATLLEMTDAQKRKARRKQPPGFAPSKPTTPRTRRKMT